MAHLLSFTLVAHLLVLLSFSSVAILAAESANKSEIDRQALISFKAGIYLDPLSVLRSWHDESINFCSWRGVTCGKALPSRVVSLDLNSLQLTGNLSPSLANLTSLARLNLGNNLLSGGIPEDLGKLPMLEDLILASNKLTGNIPGSLGTRSTSLRYINLAYNCLSGVIPHSLATSSSLTVLNLTSNNLSGMIPASLFNGSSRILVVNLQRNFFAGHIPDFRNMATLQILNLAENNLSGSIPPSLGNVSSLSEIYLYSNNLGGPVPETLSQICNLSVLNLRENILSGHVPHQLCNNSSLIFLDLGLNNLTGRIPSRIWSMLPNLKILSMFGNRMEGSTPALPYTSMLKAIDLSNNSLIGSVLPLGSLSDLYMLNLGSGQLEYDDYWTFLASLTNCAQLEFVAMDDNILNGSLPVIGNLSASLEYLAFENNKIIGPILLEVGKLPSLIALTLGQNQLDENVELRAKATTFVSLFLICPKISTGQTQKNYARLVLIGILPVTIALFSFACFVITLLKKEKRAHTVPCYKETLKKVSYNDILKATSWLSPINKISSSRTSSVYIGRFEFDTDIVAIKVFHLDKHGTLNSFLMECEVLRNTRHRNIMKVVTLCSTVDLENNEFKAIVFDFMANGNLDIWLHPKLQQNSPKRGLSMGQRIRIAMDVASALDYMHNQLTPPLVHCDLKPANVLLDYDMTARVGDFGSAKFLSSALGSSEDFVGVGGTIGYIAPEYGMGYKISTGCDVYSFGVLLLELLTGKRPTDRMFTSDMTLHKLVSSAYPNRLHEVLDPYMPQEGNHAFATPHSYLIPLVEVALSCSMELPKDRPGMHDICARIFEISEAFLESW